MTLTERTAVGLRLWPLLVLCGAASLPLSAEPLLEAPPGHSERLRIPDNPGNLSAYIYIPGRVATNPALVVALHGCGQGAEDFDDEPGWTKVADETGSILLLPEQRPRNNPLRCFNWFNPSDYGRDGGEPESIRHAIEQLFERFSVDRKRVFVAGFSAGGGMASVMLATHPDLFAGGAVIGGVPYRCARNALEALPCMQYGNRLMGPAGAWAELVRNAAPTARVRWPKVSIWHDRGDKVVNPFNAESSMLEWTQVQGADQVPEIDEQIGAHRHRVYEDAAGHAGVELWLTSGVGHATAVDGETGCGRDDPEPVSDFVTDANLCTTRLIARFWGLIDSSKKGAD